MFTDYDVKPQTEKQIMMEHKKRQKADAETLEALYGNKDYLATTVIDFDNICDDPTERFPEILQCVGCGGIMESEPLICEKCYQKNAADKHCLNCEDDKPSSQFHSNNSVICKECFSGRPKELTMREALSQMLYGNKLAKLDVQYINKTIEFHKQREILENKLAILENAFSEDYDYNKTALDELEQTQSNIRGVESDDVEEMQKLGGQIKQLKQQMKLSQAKHEAAVKKLTQSISNLEKTEEELKKKYEEAKNKYKAKTPEVMLLQKMIHNGSFTRQEILNELAEQLENIELRIAMHKLDDLFKVTGVCSVGLKKVEMRIRKGDDVDVKLIRPSENPIHAFVNKYVKVEMNEVGEDDDEAEPTINLRKKVKAGDLQKQYEVFIGKTVSPKIFAQTVGAILAEKGIEKKTVCKTNWYLGCSFTKDEDDEDDEEEDDDE